MSTILYEGRAKIMKWAAEHFAKISMKKKNFNDLDIVRCGCLASQLLYSKFISYTRQFSATNFQARAVGIYLVKLQLQILKGLCCCRDA